MALSASGSLSSTPNRADSAGAALLKGLASGSVRIPVDFRAHTSIGAAKLAQGSHGNESKLAVVDENLEFLSGPDA